MSFTPAAVVKTFNTAAEVLAPLGFEIGGFSWIKEDGFWTGLVLVMVTDGTGRTFDLTVDAISRTWREATPADTLAAI